MSSVKKTSAWIAHVKKFAADNNIKYNEALKSPNLREGYEPAPKKQRKFTMGKGKVFCTEHPDMVLVSKKVAEEMAVKPMLTQIRKDKSKMRDKELDRVKSELSGMPIIQPMALAQKEMVVSSKKVGAKRQTLGKGRDLTQPEVALMMDEAGVLNANLMPIKKGRPKKKKDE
jgi:hypothetical protein